MQILRLQLLDKRRGDRQCHKDGEESRLHVDEAVAQVPEGERVEKTSENVKQHFALHR